MRVDHGQAEFRAGHRCLSRRQLLRVGGLGSLGLTLPGLLRAEAERVLARSTMGRPSVTSPIRSCILIFHYGGPSHIDTFDMKPNAPAEIRGQFSSIATSVPGLRVCEHLPQTARVMDRLAIIRSMHHPMTNHNAAAFTALCGRNPLKGDLELLSNDRNDPPCYGAMLSATLPERRGLPTFVAVPHVMYNVVQLPGQVAGFLGSAHDPFQVSADPSAPDFHLGELELPGDLSLDRLDHRAALLHMLDGRRRHGDAVAEAAARTGRSAEAGTGTGVGATLAPRLEPRDVYTEKAFRLLHSPAVRRAFYLGSEDPRLRDRYGRTKLGQSVLLARRLVEAGVRFITVFDGQYNGQTANWDAHENVFGRLKNDLVPPADQAFAALIDDLSGRGLLEETLVIAMGEFGRTPKINGNAGRDHWPNCYSIVLAGGGVQGGITLGSSDKLGAYPDTDPVTPADLAATLFQQFGLDPAREMIDLTGRPYKLADGQPIRALFG
ncbi:MAG TPA: DUF1501 domain-containing protein [Isosphaeraceae bacterium]|nr:DUF1501 domain-containing protein [Isosphaeraceae bacterium]